MKAITSLIEYIKQDWKFLAVMLIFAILVFGSCTRDPVCTFNDYLDKPLKPESETTFDRIQFNSDGSVSHAWKYEDDFLWVDNIHFWAETNDTLWYLFNSHVAWEMKVESDCDFLEIRIETNSSLPEPYDWKLSFIN